MHADYITRMAKIGWRTLVSRSVSFQLTTRVEDIFLLFSSEPHDFSVCIIWLIDKSKCPKPRLAAKVFIREQLRLRKFSKHSKFCRLQVQPVPAAPQPAEVPQAPVVLQAGNALEPIQAPQAPQGLQDAACGEDLEVNVLFYVRGLPIGLLGPQLSCVSVCFEI